VRLSTRDVLCGVKKVVEPIKVRRSEKGIMGRVWAATRALLNSAGGHCYRAELWNCGGKPTYTRAQSESWIFDVGKSRKEGQNERCCAQRRNISEPWGVLGT